MARSNAARAGKPSPAPSTNLESHAGRSALELDRLIHERTRLSIVSALAANDALTFAELKKLLGLTDGNLSVHSRRLEEAGYISCEKSFEKRMPKTTYKLTSEGRKQLERYLAHMEALIDAARGSDASR